MLHRSLQSVKLLLKSINLRKVIIIPRKLLFVKLTEYHCGGLEGWSARFAFKALKSGVEWSPRMAVYGDLGNVNAKSISYLQEETQQGKYDAFLHVGKFSFSLVVEIYHTK